MSHAVLIASGHGSRSSMYSVPTLSARQSTRVTRMADLYYLSKRIYFCDFSDGTIFLDLRTNRYFAIQSHDMLALRPPVHRFSGNRPTVLQPGESQEGIADAIVRRLLANGVLTDSAADGKPASLVALSIDPHSHASGSVGPLSVTVMHVLNFLLS